MGVQELTQYFAQYGAFFVFFYCAAGILKSSGLSGGCDHAACWNLGGKRRGKLPGGASFVGGSRASWQLDSILFRKTWRRSFLSVLCKKVSEAERCVRKTYWNFAKERSAGSIRK